MPTIVIRKRDDRASMKVPVVVDCRGASEHVEIIRDEITEVSDAVLACLMNSHEANYINIIGIPPPETREEEMPKRKAGRPSLAELEERAKVGSAS